MAIKKGKLIRRKIHYALASIRSLECKTELLRDATCKLLQETNKLLEAYDHTRVQRRG